MSGLQRPQVDTLGMQPNYDHHPLKRLFSALVENAFCVEVGVCDPHLTDYLVALLLNFVHMDRLNKFCDAQGRRVATIPEALALLDPESRGSGRPADRDVHRYIGDRNSVRNPMRPRDGTRNSIRTRPVP